MYRRPSGAVFGKSPDLAHCSANASPTGIGCVADVLLNALCGTGFSSISSSGLPFRRFRTYIQPVLQASAIAFWSRPPNGASNNTVGDGQS